ncbi:MAG TPA: SpoIIE family protein phosphatase [Actinophytocola sp.]|uniref:SpoIIE family protein phosphatase n=1 Tax=Actinophytocola sp. TaxID=1872138 RepID=UPI002DBBD545|nr:SpoIIE family protein phosphatase [Actinophytocola sp.]HEU5472692.1 SpoIIE family protein phosphatase [Actinophytocola sp.]
MDRADTGPARAVVAAFEHTPAITWLFQGPEHRILAANRLARASVGNRPDLLGLPVRVAVPELAERDITEILDGVRASGEPMIGVEHRVEVDRDGDGVPEEMYVNFSVVPVPGPDGEPTLLVHAIEVTAWVQQRRQAEAVAHDAREMLRTEFEHTPAITWLFQGPEHRILAANRLARASVGNRPDLIGLPIRVALPELAENDITELLDAARASGEQVTGLERRIAVDRDGDGVPEEMFINFSIVPVPGSDGEPILLAHAIEVTAWVQQRRLAEAAADDARELLRTERRVVLDLQRTLLPPGLPVLPDLGLGAAYVPAGQWLAAGGDWYDVVVMPDDRVAFVVGDVVGHGATACGVMGQLRAVAAERLTRGCTVAEVLAALDRMAGLAANGRGSTVCLAVLDRPTGAFHYASRGHPLPVLLTADGQTRELVAPTGPPLGFPDTEPVIGRDRVRAGETLLLFSDGAVERPGQTITEGVATLRRRVSEGVRAAGVPARALAELVCAAAAHPEDEPATLDDLSVLAATRLTEPAPSLDLRLPGRPEHLSAVHRELGCWLDGLRVSGDDQIALELAVVEAVTNSIEHGYRAHPGDVRVDARLDRTGTIAVIVADRGGWREPSGDDPFRGRGLLMMRECSDRLDLDASPSGTTVHMRRKVRAPALGPDVKATVVEPAVAEFAVEQDRSGAATRLVLSGALDTSNAERLRTALIAANRNGMVHCTLDLDAVTLLASAALRVLYEQEARIRGAGGELVLLAAPHTPARAALMVSGLDRVLTMRSSGSQ